MKKFIVMIVAAVSLLFFPHVSFAQIGMMGSASATQQNKQELQNQVNAVLDSQNISSVDKLNCQKVTNDQFEKVGDAYMGVMSGTEANHTQMEQRMGGEGSESLNQVHIQMGENYLGCQTSGNNSWMPMMFNSQNLASKGGGFPMMGWGGYGGYGNMMNGGFGWGFGLVAVLFWIVAFIDLILLGIFLWKKIRK